MSEELIDVRIGKSVPQEEWFEAREHLAKILAGAGDSLRRNKSMETADKFAKTSRLALAALDYVANFAYDDCRYIEVHSK